MDGYQRLLVQLFQQQLQSKSKPSRFRASLKSDFSIGQSGFSSNSRVLLQMNICRNSSTRFSHSRSMGMDNFFSMIFSYFSFLVLALRFCQGTAPLIKYSKTLQMPSMSSRLPCSMPRWVLREANRAVPVRFLLSLQAMWEESLRRYFLASPKSIMYILLDFLPCPTTKLSGLISRWMKDLLCTYSILSIIWQPTMRVVFRSNFFPVMLNRSSSDLPHRSITITLQSPSLAMQYTLGSPQSAVPSSDWRALRILAQQNSWGLLLEVFSSLTAYQVWFFMLRARKTSPKAPEPSFLANLQSFATILSIQLLQHPINRPMKSEHPPIESHRTIQSQSQPNQITINIRSQPKLKTRKNLRSTPPRILSTTVKFQLFWMSISTDCPITFLPSPFSQLPQS